MAIQTPTGTKSASQINAAREANIASGKSAYSGAGATTLSSSGPIASQTKAIQNASTAPQYVNPKTGKISANLERFNAGQTGVATPTDVTPQAGTEQIGPNAQAPQSMIDQASQLQNQVNQLASSKGLTLQKNAQGGYTATPDLSAQYRQAHQTLNQAGVNPVTGGQGSAAVQTALQGIGQQQETPSILGGIQETDSMFDSLFTQYDDFFSPQVQRTSLVDEYSKLSKSLGIDNLNAELIDAKKIIEGTEDDIRNEITAAGGTATDSQVAVMSNARNKQLIKNYNTLLDTKNAATTQLSTLMELSVQDRQFAESEFDRKMNFGFKVVEFKQRATDNARSTYMTLGNQMGWDTLLASVTPYEQGIIGRTIGLDINGLNNLALRSQQDRALALEEGQLGLDLKREQIKTEQAQRSNIYSQIDERNQVNTIKTIDGKPQNASQASANSYANRLTEANQTISSLGGSFTKMSSFGNLLPNQFQSADRQLYEQAKKNFVTAVLRRESGASISPSEFSTAEKQYFPQAGDKPAVVEQKAKSRNTVINNFYNEANVARPVQEGDVVEVEGKKYKIDANGDMQPI